MVALNALPRKSAARAGAWRRRATVVGALCALLCCVISVPGARSATPAPAPTPAPALAPADYYGANIQDLIKDAFVPPSNWNTFIATMGADNLQTARMDALWAWAEPTAPVNGQHTYLWSRPGDPQNSLDHLVGMLASNGVRMLAVLSSPPSWAAGPGTQLDPSHYGDFVAFSAAFAARYGVGGTFWAQNPTLPYLPVEQFEVWTEANSANFWTTVDPAEYLKVLEPLSAAVHAVDPSAQVLASIGWQNFQAYVTQLYQLGVKGWIDGIGFHPYAPAAPGVLLLTEQLRAILDSFGDSALPIDLTEIGQPDAPSGPGAQYAYAGAVSDAARAATLSLAGDALAHGDCGVQAFDLYGLVASGTDLETYGQGYMSLFDYTTDAPNVTGSAIIAASRRWQAGPAQGLVECGSGTTPVGALLPLGVTITHTGPTCVSAVVTYYGNPIESAELVLTTADGRVDPAATDAFGQTQMCLQAGRLIKSFSVYAELSSPLSTAALTAPNVAISPTYSCPVSTVTPSPPCVPEGATVTAASSGGDVALRRCSVSAAIVMAGKLRTKLKARLTCRTGTAPSAHAHVYLERRGKHARRQLTAVVLSKARWKTVTLRARLYWGDHVMVAVPASKKIGLPAVEHTLTAPKRLGRPRSV